MIQPFLFDARHADFLTATEPQQLLRWCLVVPTEQAATATRWLRSQGCTVDRGGVHDPLTESDEYERDIVALYLDRIPNGLARKYPPLPYQQGCKLRQQHPVIREYSHESIQQEVAQWQKESNA